MTSALIVQQTNHHLWIGGRQLADVVLADIGGGAIFRTMSSCHKWQPASELLLSGATIGEKKNFVWEKPGVDLPQQFTSVLRRRIPRRFMRPRVARN